MPESLLQPHHLRLHFNPFILTYLQWVSLGVCSVEGRDSGGVFGGNGLKLGTHKVEFGVEALGKDLERLFLGGEVLGQDACQFVFQAMSGVNLRTATFIWCAYSRNITLLQLLI